MAVAQMFAQKYATFGKLVCNVYNHATFGEMAQKQSPKVNTTQNEPPH
jgi:hypothetical protein